MSDFQSITHALIDGNRDQVAERVQKALDQGAAANDILDQGLIPAMDIIGEKMENGDLFIPEVLRRARLMSATLETLKPLLSSGTQTSAGRVVIGTVKGDLHDIGKNLVAMMMEGAGFEVKDLGVDVAPEAFVASARDLGADIVAVSALLTTTMTLMRETVQALSAAGLRHRVKVMIGGAPINQTFADEIGADGYAADAGSAARKAKQLLKPRA